MFFRTETSLVSSRDIGNSTCLIFNDRFEENEGRAHSWNRAPADGLWELLIDSTFDA